MLCSNCYDNCVQTTTDKCVKYTGLPNEVLGIKTGDSLSYVEQALIGFVTANSNGTGVKFRLEPEDICSITSNFMTTCTDHSVVDYVRALSKSVCLLTTEITNIISNMSSTETTYMVGCLNVDEDGGTHVVLQATINETCNNAQSITAINFNLETNYVKVSEIDNYIADFIANNTSEEAILGHASKMVPYTVVEYYGSLGYFDATGAGTGEWTNIYLCNGNNTTPDKRGRVAVGTTTGMNGAAFAPAVNPALPGNPTYSLYSTGGSNTVTLSASQVPSHTHTGGTDQDNGHTHDLSNTNLMGRNPSGARFEGGGSNQYTVGGSLVTSRAGAHSHSFVTNPSGGGGSHPNIQPVLACHYIMYIPQ